MGRGLGERSRKPYAVFVFIELVVWTRKDGERLKRLLNIKRCLFAGSSLYHPFKPQGKVYHTQFLNIGPVVPTWARLEVAKRELNHDGTCECDSIVSANHSPPLQINSMHWWPFRMPDQSCRFLDLDVLRILWISQALRSIRRLQSIRSFRGFGVIKSSKCWIHCMQRKLSNKPREIRSPNQ